jgi:hypothetical protein
MELIKIFISYSHDDFKYMEMIRKSLAGKVQNKEIEVWTDEKIIAGEDYDSNIRTALEDADIILFLISMNFISSWYIANVELQKAVDRHKQGLVKLIPVLLEDCDFKSLSLSAKEPLPMHNKRLKPINKWTPRADGYNAVVKGLDIAIKDLRKDKQTTIPPPINTPVPAAQENVIKPAAIDLLVHKKVALLRTYYINNDFEKIMAIFNEIAPKIRGSNENMNGLLTSLSREWNELQFKQINNDDDWQKCKKDFTNRLLACISFLEKEFPDQVRS